MMDEMANHATRVRRHIEKHGHDAVEKLLDVCLSIEHLIDPHSMFLNRGPIETRAATSRSARSRRSTKFKAKDYMDRWINPPAKLEAEAKKHRDEAKRRSATSRPRSPTRDVLLYLLEHAPLEDWQADCLSIVREESYYFAPQGMTKVMNEGWASYWHSHADDQALRRGRRRSSTTPTTTAAPSTCRRATSTRTRSASSCSATSKTAGTRASSARNTRRPTTSARRRRWDKGLGLGREKIFEVRRVYNDVNFIDEFMTPEFIEKHKFYQYGRDPHTGQLRIVSRDPQRIKQTLLYQLTNMGQPFIYVVDGNYCNRGELYLAHQHNGLDIEIKFAVETLKNVYKIWQRPGAPAGADRRRHDPVQLRRRPAQAADDPRRPAEAGASAMKPLWANFRVVWWTLLIYMACSIVVVLNRYDVHGAAGYERDGRYFLDMGHGATQETDAAEFYRVRRAR